MKDLLTGACGESYVAAYLTRKKLIVALPRAGTPGSDLFVAPVGNGRSIRIQVKTGTDSKRSPKWADKKEIRLWRTSLDIIENQDEYHLFAYVWLKEWPEVEQLPEVFFIPSADVAERMKPEREELGKNPNYQPFFWGF